MNVFSDANIVKKAQEFCDNAYKAEKKALLVAFSSTWPKPDLKSVSNNPGTFTMPVPNNHTGPTKFMNGITKPAQLGTRPSGKKQDKYDADLKAYNENEALKKKFKDETDAYNGAKQAYDKEKKQYEDTKKAYDDYLAKYNAAGYQGKQDDAAALARWTGKVKTKEKELVDARKDLMDEFAKVKQDYESKTQNFVKTGHDVRTINEIGLDSIENFINNYTGNIEKFPARARELIDKNFPPITPSVSSPSGKTPSKPKSSSSCVVFAIYIDLL